jgi:hypothetical protein
MRDDASEDAGGQGDRLVVDVNHLVVDVNHNNDELLL